MTLRIATSVVTLFMEARVGPKLLGHFGLIHLLAVLTLWSVPMAYVAARRRDLRAHRVHMVGTYTGAILIAGGLAFAPGRFLH